jgi:hypothetical protein
MTTQKTENRWQIDKHIPVAFILAFLVQGVAAVWWFSGLQYKLQDHERRITNTETTRISERMAVVEAQLRDSREIQLEMNRKLDKLVGGSRQ